MKERYLEGRFPHSIEELFRCLSFLTEDDTLTNRKRRINCVEDSKLHRLGVTAQKELKQFFYSQLLWRYINRRLSMLQQENKCVP